MEGASASAALNRVGVIRLLRIVDKQCTDIKICKDIVKTKVSPQTDLPSRNSNINPQVDISTSNINSRQHRVNKHNPYTRKVPDKTGPINYPTSNIAHAVRCTKAYPPANLFPNLPAGSQDTCNSSYYPSYNVPTHNKFHRLPDLQTKNYNNTN